MMLEQLDNYMQKKNLDTYLILSQNKAKWIKDIMQMKYFKTSRRYHSGKVK